MFQSWRQRLRQASVAFKRGRLEQAYRHLSEGDLREFLPAQKLAACVAKSLAERAQVMLDRGDTSAGWRDLQAAESLGGADTRLDPLRAVLTERSLAEVLQYLAAEQPQQAQQRLAILEQRGGEDRRLRTLGHVARFMEEAERLGRRGRFAEADARLASAQALAPEIKIIATLRERYRENLADCQRRSPQLHDAVTRKDWTETLETAEALLAIAPENAPALAARRRAWDAVGMPASRSGRTLAGARYRGQHSVRPVEHPCHHCSAAEKSSDRGSSVSADRANDRFLLWVDAVGGFLVCLGDQINIGQPSLEGDVDIPILADLSRRHAVIRRDGEAYLIEPVHTTWIEGRELTGVTELHDGETIELGRTVQLRFRRPHALSATARLDILSHHKTQPAADAILLMAESCVLGAAPHSHIRCREWANDVILFRHGDQLHCRTTGLFQIDGCPCEAHGQLSSCAQIEGEDFSLSLEPLGHV
jgi:hypothetical protein